MPVYIGSSPAKIILSGEHAVVHHTRAIATVVERRTIVKIIPINDNDDIDQDFVTLTFHHNDGKQYCYQWKLNDIKHIHDTHINSNNNSNQSSSLTLPSSTIFDSLKLSLMELVKSCYIENSPFNESIIVFLLYFILLYRCRSSIQALISSDIPLAAGLGSSASFCAAAATTFYGLSKQYYDNNIQTVNGQIITGQIPLNSKDLSSINDWAFEGEKLIHGNPSGVDNTCVVYGGVIVYQRNNLNEIKIKHLPKLPSNTIILITHTKQSRDTKILVESVRQLKLKFPLIINPIIESIDNIAQEWIDIIESKPLILPMKELSLLITINQSLLKSLGVSHKTIEHVIAITDKYNLVSKLTGAGGGGCVISLQINNNDNTDIDSNDGSIDSAREELVANGYVCIEGVCGQNGVELSIEH